MKIRLITITPLFFAAFLVAPLLVSAQEPFSEPSMPGTAEGTGTHFEITDSEYLNISLQSTEEITAYLESIPKIISLNLEASSSTNNTNLTISNLEPNKTYHKFQDSYKNEAVFVSDEQGDYTWNQDLTRSHHIWFQPGENGTVFLPEDCGIYGIWDELTSTCTLTQDLTQSVEITADNITLDCQSHKIIGSDIFSGFGIYTNNKKGAAIKNCNIENFSYGIYFYNVSDSKIEGNNIFKTFGPSIWLSHSPNNSLSDNSAPTIYLFSSPDNSLSNNSISWALVLDSSSNNTLKNNNIGERLSIGGHFLQNIDETNEVNGKPIYYWINAENKQIPSDAGFVGAINSENIVVKDLNLRGLIFVSTKNSIVENVNVSVGGGIYFYSSDNNRISNSISTRNYHGIFLESSNNNEILNNDITGNIENGISLSNSDENVINENNISVHALGPGIYLTNSSRNKIYHNNLRENCTLYAPLEECNALVEGGTDNFFDNGYPSGGNYWHDYAGIDERYGPNQDRPGPDGMGDTPYTFTGGQDRYPFMEENGWEAPPVLTYNVAVILAEPTDVSHESATTTAQPCKLIPEKTYSNGHTKEYYQDLTYCVKDYYFENSYGMLNLNFTIYDNNRSWYQTATSSKDYGNWYQAYQQGSTMFNDYDFGGRDFMKDVVLEASSTGVDFSSYDTVGVVRSGVKLTQTNFNDGSWHPRNEAWPLLPFLPYEFVVSEFNLTGSWTHEMGHNFGTILSTGHKPLCDLYKTQAGDCGGSVEEETKIKEWDLMAEGSLSGIPERSGSSPTHLSSFSKIKLNWLKEELIDAGNYLIESLETMKFGDEVKRFNISTSSYYLLEARTPREEFSKWDFFIPSAPEDALVIYKTRVEDIQGQPTPILNKIKVLNTDDDYYRNLADWFRVDTKGAIVDIPNKSFKIDTQIKRQGEPRYIVGNLRPNNSSLKQIWSFTGPYAEPLPPVIIINRSLKLCDEMFGADACTGCYPFPDWEILDDVSIECPPGYKEMPGFGYECRASKVPRCCTEGKAYDAGGDCNDVVINYALKQCAFVDDITLCTSLLEGWERPREKGPYFYIGWVCPEEYEWVDDVICPTIGTTTTDHEVDLEETTTEEAIIPPPTITSQFPKDFQKPYKGFFEKFWLTLLLLTVLGVSVVLRLLLSLSPKQKRILELVIIGLVLAFISIILVDELTDETQFKLVERKYFEQETFITPTFINEIIPGIKPINLDLDFHAYDDQGRHVGINYETGEYENQIPDAISSGDLSYDDEWIAVPEGTSVRFLVSSQDVQETLEAYPGLQGLTDGIETYTVQGIYYDSESQRYESNVVAEQINPGIELEHQITGTRDIAVGPGFLIVDIDIKPGSYPNSINLKSKGVTPVAVLTDEFFDVKDIVVDSVVFAGTSPKKRKLEDVDNDGDLDLILHFNTQLLQLSPTSTEAVLTGQLTNGALIKGTDSVKIVQEDIKQTIFTRLFSYINQFIQNLISAIGLAAIR